MILYFTKRLGLRESIVIISLILVLGVAIYARTLNSPFVFDDIHSIVQNEARRDLDLSLSNWFGTRSIPYLSFDLNYHFSELNVTSYHLVNIALHLLNSIIVTILAYFIAAKSYHYHQWNFRHLIISNHWLLAAIAGLIFLVHPLQTQGVNYIVQRMVPMATLFYFSSILFYWLHRISKTKTKTWLWGITSLLLAVLSMQCKEIAITLPVAIPLIEYLFFSSKLSLLAKRWYKILPWLLTILIIPSYLLGVGEIFFQEEALAPHAQEDTLTDKVNLKRALDVSAETGQVGRWTYFTTQWHVIARYIRLLFIPIGLNIDHHIPYQENSLNPTSIGSLIFILLIVAAGIWLYFKKRYVAAAGIAFFFLTLSVESGIIPITDTIFEHRVYLPMFGFVLVVMDFFAWLFKRLRSSSIDRRQVTKAVFLIPTVLLLLLSVISFTRNGIWKNEITLWSDAVSKSPDKPRPLNNLGLAYVDAGENDKAEELYRHALRVDPENVDAMINLGVLLGQEKRTTEAAKILKQAIETKPELASGYSNLGNVYMLQHKYEEAAKQYRQALQYKPKDATLWASIGDTLIERNETKEAINAYEKAVAIKENADWYNRLGALYAMTEKYAQAKQMLEKALELDPTLTAAKNNLRRVRRQDTK